MTDRLRTIRTSERYALGRCHQRWLWEYRFGLVPKGETPDALWFGIGVHEALAAWYLPGKKRGPHPADTFEDWAGDSLREIRASREEWEELPKFEDARELGISMLEGYVDEWGKDPGWSVIAMEEPFKVRVLRGGEPVALFQSRWDGVFRDLADGRIYLLENKTASQIQTVYLEMDPQAGAYSAVADNVLRAKGVLKKGERIAGIQYNFLRKAKKDDRPRTAGGAYLNQDGSVSKRQPAPRFVRPEPVERTPAELRAEMDHLADEAILMDALQYGQIPVTKNRTKDCPWCQFWDMCKLHERGGDDWKEIAKSNYVQRDPYAENLKSASE